MRDIDLTLDELVNKYGKLEEKGEDLVDSTGRVRRINHSRANQDFMDEMEEGILFHSLSEEHHLSMEELVKKYGQLTLTEYDYYVDSKGIIRRILPYTPLVR
jgi:hypothetical protein